MYCELFAFYTSKQFRFGCTLLPIINIINNIFNNILFIVLSMIIEICLNRFAKKFVQKRMQMFNDQKYKDDALEHQKKIKRLILINGVLNLFSHLPELVTTILSKTYFRNFLILPFLIKRSSIVQKPFAFCLLACSFL